MPFSSLDKYTEQYDLTLDEIGALGWASEVKHGMHSYMNLDAKALDQIYYLEQALTRHVRRYAGISSDKGAAAANTVTTTQEPNQQEDNKQDEKEATE